MLKENRTFITLPQTYKALKKYFTSKNVDEMLDNFKTDKKFISDVT